MVDELNEKDGDNCIWCLYHKRNVPIERTLISIASLSQYVNVRKLQGILSSYTSIDDSSIKYSRHKLPEK